MIYLFYSFKLRINDYFNQIFVHEFKMILSTQKFRTLGLGEMADRYNEYLGSLDPRKEELDLAEQIEIHILKIYPTIRTQSILQMMVFVP